MRTTIRGLRNALFCLLFFLFATAGWVDAAAIIYQVNNNDPACVNTSDPPCFTAIQPAIDAARNALISIPSNTNTYAVQVESSDKAYAGGITLVEGIDLMGRETARTIIDGAGQTIISATNIVKITNVRNFTFQNGQTGFLVQSSGAAVNILNNIFQNNVTAVQVQASLNAVVRNNTFFNNTTAVSRDEDISIANNIFFNNSTAINPGPAAANVSNNDFFSNTDQTVLGSNPISTATVTDPAPDFVNTDTAAGPLDFHLRAGSPCIDAGLNATGAGDSFDGTVTDIGTYGGPSSDTIPFIISGLASTLTSTSPTSTISISWDPNLAYQVNGYRVHYGTSPAFGGNQAAEGASPLLISGGTTTATLSNLVSSVASTLSPPTLLPLEPGNQSLAVKWVPSDGATGYIISYSTLSFDQLTLPATSVTINDGSVTSWTLTGLENLQTYYVAVRATAQQRYYIAVTAIEGSGTRDPGKSFESTLTDPPISQAIGTTQESGISDVLQEFPEAATPYPDLVNSGCFIATAAYGSYSAPEVRLLRRFRDAYLMTNAPGRTFVAWYYRYGPVAAEFVNSHAWLKPAVRLALLPAVGGASFLLRASLPVKIAVILFSASLFLYVLRKLRARPTGGAC